MKNNGFDDIEYSFGYGEELDAQVSKLINEFVHVFRYHADGNWKADYKPRYVEEMASFIDEKPSLIRKLLALRDPVVSNITYAAIEFNKSKENDI